MKRRALAGIALAALTLAGSGCTVTTGARQAERNTARSAETAPGIIRALLDSTAAGWNRGDLPTYLSVYTPDATEMRSTGPAGGVEAIEQTMKNGFWRTGRPTQNLRYEHVLVRMLGADGAVVTGQFILSGAGAPDRTGWFTTAWIRDGDTWKMIHDHS